MFSEYCIYALPAVLAVLLASCSPLKRYAALSESRGHVTISVPEAESEDASRTDGSVHEVEFRESDGGPVIMNAIRDSETGEMTATDVIRASKVTARFRNIAERLGRISFSFDITVPGNMISSALQLRFFPVVETDAGRSGLKPVFITGSGYRKRQVRGYERYRQFIESIVTDSSVFVRKDQLETFLERYFPEAYALKTDSSFVSEPVEENLFGVSRTEVLEHYKNHAGIRRNERKKAEADARFRRYVRSPIETEAVLDTVMSSGDGTLTYRYIHSMRSGPGQRKLHVILGGKVYRDGEQVAEIPPSEKLTYYISSLSALADNSPRYIFRIVDRIVTDNTDAYLDFRQGSAEIDTLSEWNSAELGRIRRCFADVYSRKDLVLDSVIVTASCSPEGSWEYNTGLASRRSDAIRSYIVANVAAADSGLVKTGYVPENWDQLLRIVSNDTVLEPASIARIVSAAGIGNKDEAERKLAAMPEYRYLREKIYPRLRVVNLKFHLHRSGVRKDTVHTREIDTVYMRGLAALRDLDYRTAASLLGPYNDYNAALALASSGYDDRALDILSMSEAADAKADYLEAVLLARLGEFDRAAESFRKSVCKDPSIRHRANLDPEMTEVLIRDKESRLMFHTNQ